MGEFIFSLTISGYGAGADCPGHAPWRRKLDIPAPVIAGKLHITRLHENAVTITLFFCARRSQRALGEGWHCRK
jgi:hypothetical protein